MGFHNHNVILKANMKDETVWMSQNQTAQLFGKAKSTINEHIKMFTKKSCQKMKQ